MQHQTIYRVIPHRDADLSGRVDSRVLDWPGVYADEVTYKAGAFWDRIEEIKAYHSITIRQMMETLGCTENHIRNNACRYPHQGLLERAAKEFGAPQGWLLPWGTPLDGSERETEYRRKLIHHLDGLPRRVRWRLAPLVSYDAYRARSSWRP